VCPRKEGDPADHTSNADQRVWIYDMAMPVKEKRFS
jgi:hypothetical protein